MTPAHTTVPVAAASPKGQSQAHAASARAPLRRNGLSPAQLAAAVVAVVALHLGGGWALLQIPAVTDVVRDVAPVFVSLIAPEAAPPVAPPPVKPLAPVTPPAALPPKPPTAAQALPTPAAAPVLTAAPSPAPAPAAVAPVAPQPVPGTEAPAAAVAPVAAMPLKVLPTESIQYLVKPVPEYPVAAKRLRLSGTVRVWVLVDDTGRSQEVRVSASSGHAQLDDAAVAAVRRARFKPYVENGKPLPAATFIPISFNFDSELFN